jgi:ketosteroid isomerase-like protein
MAETQSGDAAAQVLAADAAFRAAVCAGDAAGLDALLTPQFVYIHSTGLEDSRAEFLARAKGGPVTYVKRDVQGVVARVHGDAAALTGHTAIGFQRAGHPVETRWSNFLASWVRSGGTWRMAAYCGAPLPDPA